MTFWAYLDKHPEMLRTIRHAIGRLVFFGILLIGFANDLSWDELRYWLLMAGGEGGFAWLSARGQG